MAASVKMTTFWHIALCSLAEVDPEDGDSTHL
jgi:hypothetical protein